MVSMPHGPVLSQLLDSINFRIDGDPWCEYLSERDRYDIALTRPDPENDELSIYELELLKNINNKFGDLDWKAISKLTHDLPEWNDPKG